MQFKVSLSWIGLLCLFVFSSCVSTKKVKQIVYLNDLSDSINHEIAVDKEPQILPGDRVSITIGALKPESAIPYNPPVAATTLTTATTPPGYLVNNDGTIQLPQLGTMRVAGLTRQQLVDTLTNVMKTYVVDPVVTVQITNFKITVLGDVASPGTKLIPEGKLNLFEAIGLSGDLQITGRRDNVLVIREKNGKREFGRVNLTSTRIFNSPYYHLQQNDIVYVEMSKTKIDASDQTLVRNVSIGASILSVLTTLIVLIINLN